MSIQQKIAALEAELRSAIFQRQWSEVVRIANDLRVLDREVSAFVKTPLFSVDGISKSV